MGCMGWLSYVLAGTETHRYHHSANLLQAGNYGATLMIYDLLFGTFVYRPGIPPEELGIDPTAQMPDYAKTLAVLNLPFAGR